MPNIRSISSRAFYDSHYAFAAKNDSPDSEYLETCEVAWILDISMKGTCVVYLTSIRFHPHGADILKLGS